MPARSGRHFLQVPGPTNVPDRVLRAIDQPIIDHRGPEFTVLCKGVLAGLKRLLGCAGPILIYPSSGTGAWEAAILNTLSPGDKVLAFETGHFANMWNVMAKKHGLEVDFVPGDWRHGADAAVLEARLTADRGHAIKAVMVVHNETSTGVTSRVAALRQAIDRARHPALFMVDGISSVAAMEYRQDDWGIDVGVVGSQKGLMLPPGLAFNAVSAKALAAHKHAKLPRGYFEWQPMIDANDTGLYPFTPPIPMFFGLREAVAMLEEEGLANVFARHARFAEATRRAVRAWGLDILSADPREHSAALTGGDGAGGAQCRRRPRRHPRALRPVARRRARQDRRQGVSHRPSRLVQRSDAGRHVGRGRDGPGRRRRAAPQGRRRRRHGLSRRQQCGGAMSAAAAAALLIAARRTGQRLAGLPDAIAPRDDDAAYAVQDEVVRQLGLGVAGWKVGAANPTALPSAAPLMAGLVAPSPASVAVTPANFRAAEVELAFSFARTLPARAAPYGEDEVWEAVAACHVAIELLDTRYVDRARMTPAVLLADNLSNGFFTYGAPMPAWRSIDFLAAPASLTIDGAQVKSAVHGTPGGHPRRLLAWLASHAASRGRPLGPGIIVTTGSHTGLAVAPPGAQIVARFTGLGEAELRLTAA